MGAICSVASATRVSPHGVSLGGKTGDAAERAQSFGAK